MQGHSVFLVTSICVFGDLAIPTDLHFQVTFVILDYGAYTVSTSETRRMYYLWTGEELMG